MAANPGPGNVTEGGVNVTPPGAPLVVTVTAEAMKQTLGERDAVKLPAAPPAWIERDGGVTDGV